MWEKLSLLIQFKSLISLKSTHLNPLISSNCSHPCCLKSVAATEIVCSPRDTSAVLLRGLIKNVSVWALMTAEEDLWDPMSPTCSIYTPHSAPMPHSSPCTALLYLHQAKHTWVPLCFPSVCSPSSLFTDCQNDRNSTARDSPHQNPFKHQVLSTSTLWLCVCVWVCANATH